MKIKTLTLGDYQTNCYLVFDETTRAAVVIDPGYAPDTILAALRDEDLSLRGILLTHGHFDHVGAVDALMRQTGCRCWVHEKDLSLPEYLRSGLRHTDLYDEGDVLRFDGLRFEVLHTPGHTPGSVVLRTDGVLFTGDTLFAGSCGRTDLAGGSSRQLLDSLARLAALEGDFTVLCGHGEDTTLEDERQGNPWLRYAVEKGAGR